MKHKFIEHLFKHGNKEQINCERNIFERQITQTHRSKAVDFQAKVTFRTQVARYVNSFGGRLAEATITLHSRPYSLGIPIHRIVKITEQIKVN